MYKRGVLHDSIHSFIYRSRYDSLLSYSSYPAVMNLLNEVLRAESPSAYVKDKKQSSAADSPAPLGEDLQLRVDSGDYPAPLARWVRVITLFLGKSLVGIKTLE